MCHDELQRRLWTARFRTAYGAALQIQTQKRLDSAPAAGAGSATGSDGIHHPLTEVELGELDRAWKEDPRPFEMHEFFVGDVESRTALYR